jgi:transcriptional regulator with XRE-family HTH domain
MQIGEQIRARRKELGLSQEDMLAELKKNGAETSAPTFSRWENCKSVPNKFKHQSVIERILNFKIQDPKSFE